MPDPLRVSAARGDQARHGAGRIRSASTRWAAVAAVSLLGAAACAAPGPAAAPGPGAAATPTSSWTDIQAKAKGQTVSLWMWGGDPKGNAYVDKVLAPAAKGAGVTLRRVPVADTKDALNRVLAERQAGRADGSRLTQAGSPIPHPRTSPGPSSSGRPCTASRADTRRCRRASTTVLSSG